MSQELIYTSAPQGLKPGSRGFCTVASTAGMPKNLAERLESFSGYRHVFPPNDANAIHNPVVYSHLRIVVGGRPYHVLSRISAAGIDYTQRSNKLAHHIALDVQELVSAGPAALLACRDFLDTTWVGEPRVIAAGRKPPHVNSVQSVCRHWERLTGDAGWGGRLADAASSKPFRTVAVIFKPGMDVLPLVSESLSLLPPAVRWQVTFSTYFTKLPPGIECNWRFLLEGSPEAKAAERSSQVETIVLGKKLGPAPDGPLVVAARTGKPPTWPTTTKAVDHSTDEFDKHVLQHDDGDLQFDVSELNPIPLFAEDYLGLPVLPANAARFQRVSTGRHQKWLLLNFP